MTAEQCRAYLADRHRRMLVAEPPPYVGKHRLAIEDLVDEIYPKVAVALAPAALAHQVWPDGIRVSAPIRTKSLRPSRSRG